MSAFVVNKTHIDYLLTFGLKCSRNRGPLRWMVPAPVNPEAYQRGEPWGPEAIEECNKRRRELTRETADSVGCMLAAENRRSVDHRYDENEIEDLYEYDSNSIRSDMVDAVQTLKAIDCYEYQSCEHPEWETSEAHDFCRALRKYAISTLRGYDEADWEIKPKTPRIRCTA